MVSYSKPLYIFKKITAKTNIKKILSYASLRSFIAVGLALKSFIYFKLISVYGAR